MNIKGNGNIVISGSSNSFINVGTDYSYVRKQLEKGYVKNALDSLPNTEEISALRARYSSNERKNGIGLITNSEHSMEQSNINWAILKIIQELENPVTQIQQPEITMNRYSSLSKSDCAVVLSKYFTDIEPTNRPSVAKLVSEIKNCQEVLNYSKLQELLGEFAALLVNPAVDNHKDIVFKQSYDALVAKTIATLTAYLKVIDNVMLRNESSIDALTRLNATKSLDNLKLWKDALCRESGTNFPKIQEIESSYNTWVEYLGGFDAVEQEIMIDFQVIDDLKRVSK